MHERLSVHSICFPHAGIEELGRNWHALGCRRVSFSSLQVLEYGAQHVRNMLDAAGQRTETITHVFSPTLTPGPMAEEASRLARTIEAAATLGARSIYMLTGGRGALSWEASAEIFANAIAPCRKLAREAGVALAIENTSPFFAHGHLATNLRDTISLAEIADIGICIDYFACWTEAGMQKLLARAMPRCVLVQVSDYVVGDRALPCRAVPGDGAIPWPAVLRWLRDAGYDGTFDLELLGPRMDAEGHMAAVRRTGDVMANWLGEMDNGL